MYTNCSPCRQDAELPEEGGMWMECSESAGADSLGKCLMSDVCLIDAWAESWFRGLQGITVGNHKLHYQLLQLLMQLFFSLLVLLQLLGFQQKTQFILQSSNLANTKSPVVWHGISIYIFWGNIFTEGIGRGKPIRTPSLPDRWDSILGCFLEGIQLGRWGWGTDLFTGNYEFSRISEEIA